MIEKKLREADIEMDKKYKHAAVGILNALKETKKLIKSDELDKLILTLL